MMKRILIPLLLTFFVCNANSQEYFWKQKWGDIINDGAYGFIEDGRFILKIAAKSPGDKKGKTFYKYIKNEDLRPDNDGYVRTSFFGGKQIMMYGGNWIIFSSEIKPQNLDHYIPHMNNAESLNKNWEYFYSGIAKVSSDSFLSENNNNKQYEYRADTLNQCLLFDSYTCWISRWNHEKLPWAEGEEGPGIGVTLDIEFEKPSGHILVINGYVDFGKTHLYKANNRVKDAVIRSLDPENLFEINVHFDDVVRFHEFRFPAESRKVQFEIKSVYKGEKWDDTVTTGFQLRNPENMYDQWKDNFLQNAIEYEEWMEFEY